jgi:hypothetical protein
MATSTYRDAVGGDSTRWVPPESPPRVVLSLDRYTYDLLLTDLEAAAMGYDHRGLEQAAKRIRRAIHALKENTR